MATLGTMKARIADEIARSDLTSQIVYAINDAIAHHERARFYFNEAQGTFSTVAAQEWYSSSDAAWIATAVEIDSLRLTISGNPWPLIKTTLEELEYLTAGTATNGDPTRWCYYRQQVRLYPVPNAVRTVTGSYVQRITALSSDEDSNAWTDDAERLIRTRAKIMLYEEVIRGDAGRREADRLRGIEAEELGKLRAETRSRIGSGMIAAIYL